MESEKYNYFYKFIDKLQLTWLQKQKEKNYKTKSYITRLKCKTVLFHKIKKEFGTTLQKSLIKI